MAEPILFTPPQVNPREILIHRLENAPQEHAAALLDAYEILQELRDKGLLEIAKGALGSGEQVLEIFTKKIESDEVIRTMRNGVILLKLVGSLDPEKLERLVRALNGSITDAATHKPPGLFRLLGRLTGANVRRVLAAAIGGLEALGQSLADDPHPHQEPKGKKRTVYRHSA
jgi:uncharacterized protein YjgD (DUF1641 family)